MVHVESLYRQPLFKSRGFNLSGTSLGCANSSQSLSFVLHGERNFAIRARFDLQKLVDTPKFARPSYAACTGASGGVSKLVVMLFLAGSKRWRLITPGTGDRGRVRKVPEPYVARLVDSSGSEAAGSAP